MFKNIYKNGFIEEKTLKLPFCLECEKQLADRYIEGECPKCDKQARGDQCESCSSVLDPIQLINPKCTICNSKKIEFRDEKHLFLKLNKLEPELKKWINENDQLRIQVKNLALSWIKEGLKPRCITRDLKWGIKVPLDGYENKVFYVWFDAPIGYISSTKEWNKEKWRDFWTNSKMYNFIGKDNIPFHTIFFPGMLLADKRFSLAYNVVGLQYCNYERQKISKSKSFGVFCENLAKAGLDSDYWRFYSTYLIPETKDTDFLWNEFKERINSDLIGNIGNLINRTTTFLQKNFNGKVPEPDLTEEDKHFISIITKEIKNTLEIIEKVKLREGLENILKISAYTNKYFQDNAPWSNEERSKTIMYLCINICEKIGILLLPYIPSKSKELLEIINSKERDFSKIEIFNIKPTHKINKPKILFNKIEDEQLKKIKQIVSKVTEYFKEESKVELEEFQKLDIRIGTIIRIEDHPNADKLFILKVDLGEREIQIVSGIKDYYTKEELKNKQIPIIVNLKPTKLRGVNSDGMLLAASKNNKLTLLTVDKKIENNSKVS